MEQKYETHRIERQVRGSFSFWDQPRTIKKAILENQSHSLLQQENPWTEQCFNSN